MSRFNNPVPQFLDDAGAVVTTNGKLYFYETGTSTLKDTYADSSLKIANSNPVLLDASGRAPNIFLSGTYKVVLEDDTGQIWEKDPVSGIGEAQWSDWSATTIYDRTDIVRGPDLEYYVSEINGNLGNDPSTSPVQWTLIPIGELQAIEYFADYAALRAKSNPGVGSIAVVDYRTSSADQGGGTFVWSNANLVTEVTADSQSGIYVAPDSDPTGSSGAWIRQYSEKLNSDWFGTVHDATTDDSPALQAALDYAGSLDTAKKVFCPAGTYRFLADTSAGTYYPLNTYVVYAAIVLTASHANVTLEGEGHATEFKFDSNNAPISHASLFHNATGSAPVEITFKNFTVNTNNDNNIGVDGVSGSQQARAFILQSIIGLNFEGIKATDTTATRGYGIELWGCTNVNVHDYTVDTTNGIKTDYCEGMIIADSYFTGHTEAIDLDKVCKSVSITGCAFHDASQTGENIDVNACEGVTVSGCSFENTGRALIVNCKETWATYADMVADNPKAWQVGKSVNFSGNAVVNAAYNQSLDQDRSVITIGNTWTGAGVDHSGDAVTSIGVTGNTFYKTGIIAVLEGFELDISDNTLEDIVAPASQTYYGAISLRSSVGATDTLTSTGTPDTSSGLTGVCCNNVIVNFDRNGIEVGTELGTPSAPDDANLVIEGNYTRRGRTSATGAGAHIVIADREDRNIKGSVSNNICVSEDSATNNDNVAIRFAAASAHTSEIKCVENTIKNFTGAPTKLPYVFSGGGGPSEGVLGERYYRHIGTLAATSSELQIGPVPTSGQVVRVGALSSTAVSASGTNYWNFVFSRRQESGGLAGAFSSVNRGTGFTGFQNVVLEEGITDTTGYDHIFTRTDGGQSLTTTVTKNGTAANLNDLIVYADVLEM